MVSSHIKRNMDLLRYLAKANRKSLPVVNAIIKTADKSLMDSLCECSLNTLCGNVPLKPTEGELYSLEDFLVLCSCQR